MENFKNFEADTEFGKLYSDMKRISDKLDLLYQKEPEALEMSFKEHVSFIPLFASHREEILNAINFSGLTIDPDNVIFGNYSSILGYTSCKVDEHEIHLETYINDNIENDRDIYEYYAIHVVIDDNIYIVETFGIYDILYIVNSGLGYCKDKDYGDIMLECANLTIGAFGDRSPGTRFDIGINTITEW